ncbi:MAG: DUF6090 family protein [Woeseiaceae bacterium]
MLLERLQTTFAKSSFGSFALELIVVILGILIAFQIDHWAEDRRDREHEYAYLMRLKEDFQIEIQSMDAALRYAESRIANVVLLEEVLANPSVALERPGAVTIAIEKVTWRSFPQINAFVYSELQNTGNLALIRSESLRRSLANHYASIRHHERVGLDFNIQHQFDRLTAGILSTSELQAIEDESWNNVIEDVSSERAHEMVQELARRRDAIELLPDIAQHHIFNKKVMESTRSRALEIIELIDSLTKGFEQ